MKQNMSWKGDEEMKMFWMFNQFLTHRQLGTNLVGVPITVKDDDSVGSLQVQAQSTSSGT